VSDSGKCVKCHRELRGGYFTVLHHRVDGRVTGQVKTCSVLCLITWAYAYGVKRGVEGIATIQGAIGRLVEAAKAGG